MDKKTEIIQYSKILAQKYGLSFIETDGNLDNVIFSNDEKKVKIAHCMYFRYSGICKTMKYKFSKKGIVYFEWVDIDNKSFVFDYIKMIIENSFKL